MEEDKITEAIIGAAIEVHRHLGPGPLESTYETCLCHELTLRDLSVVRQKVLPVHYKGFVLEECYRVDLIVEKKVITVIKSVSALQPVHQAQLLTYLKLANLRVGLLINFTVAVVKNGLKHLVNG